MANFFSVYHFSKACSLRDRFWTIFSFWDLRSYKCVRSLKCDEPIIGVSFEASGSLIALVFQSSGVAMYNTKTSQAVLTCPLPIQERKPVWTAYCVSNNFKRVIVAGDNGLLYIWDLTEALGIDERDGSNRHPMECVLVGVVELPVKVRKAIDIKLSNNISH